MTTVMTTTESLKEKQSLWVCTKSRQVVRVLGNETERMVSALTWEVVDVGRMLLLLYVHKKSRVMYKPAFKGGSDVMLLLIASTIDERVGRGGRMWFFFSGFSESRFISTWSKNLNWDRVPFFHFAGRRWNGMGGSVANVPKKVLRSINIVFQFGLSNGAPRKDEGLVCLYIRRHAPVAELHCCKI